MVKGTHHNYDWLFCELKNTLARAETDEEFNRQYAFHEQKKDKIQWPQKYINELAGQYSKVVNFNVDGARLRSKIFNTRVNSFRRLAQRSSFSADYEYVHHFQPERLLLNRYSKPIRDFKPATHYALSRDRWQDLPWVPPYGLPQAPAVPIPCAGTILANQIVECGFDAHLTLELLGLVVGEYGPQALAGVDIEMRMAVLLRT